MSLGGKTGSLANNITKGGNIDSATVINVNNDLPINYLLFFFCLILILITYFGPFLYFKIVRKKSFNPQRTMGVSHVV